MSNSNVIWSVNPPVGTIVNGVYQAPATITGQQTVTITATSAAPLTLNGQRASVLSAPGNTQTSHLITGFALNSPPVRNNFTGFVGMAVTVGSNPLTVYTVGRVCLGGNSQSHLVKFVNVSGGTDFPGGSAMVNMSGCTPGQFVYASLAAPITLSAGGAYYLVSQETSGGDAWYDHGTVTTTSDATVTDAVWLNGTTWSPIGTPSASFVPPDFGYSVLTSISPAGLNGTSFVSAYNLNGAPLRNNYAGYVGMEITVGANALSVSEVGRVCAAASTQTHNVEFVQVSTGAAVPGASAQVNMSGCTPGQFVYASLSSPVTLPANTAYYLVSQEFSGGDLWFNYAPLTPTGDAAVNNAVWGSGGTWNPAGPTNYSFVPPNFVYSLASAPTNPVTVNTPSGTSFVSAYDLNGAPPRNNYAGYVGMEITVGANALSVSEVGRVCAAASTQTHNVEFVQVSTGAAVPGASAQVNMSGCTPGQFVYASLSSPVTLPANTAYYLVSQEFSGGDLWFDYAPLTPTGDAAVNNAVWGSGGIWNPAGPTNYSFVPPNFIYSLASAPSNPPKTPVTVNTGTSTLIATATVTLIPVSISITPPANTSLTGGQSATFTATVSGSANTGVTWSLSPAIGTITNGVYQAPAVIASQQTITVTATSVADTTKSATSTVTLTPVGITLGPTGVSLTAGQSATFSAALTGTTNTGVTWSLSPPTGAGTIVSGVYTAPPSITSTEQVTVIATSVADPTKAATVQLTLTNASSGTVTLPVEVMGANGTTASVTVTVPSGSNLSGPLNLWMQIHGLKYDTEASVEVNNSGWLPISTGNVTLLGNAAAFGGIGGGFRTLQLTMNLPAGAVVAGNNTVTFQFNATNGVVSGYRVLAFNFQSAGTNLIPSSQFVEDDPNNWQAPSTNASDIAAGQALYQGAALTTPNGPIQAHCSDCHAQDGRDLKYFNYSNHSIEVRAMFHGLTAQQGAQIASYIRSLNVPNPGRPWNPPYQPGPGLDSQPVENWSAGAGLDAVLDNDGEMLQYLTPGGSTAGFSAKSYLNPRETPVTLQLLDWNSWLPVIHPMDAFGSAFTTSLFNTLLPVVRSILQPNSPAAYQTALGQLHNWTIAEITFLSSVDSSNPNWAANNLSTEVYSAALWGMVKRWEVNQVFGLEGMPQVPYGATADLRGWFENIPFNSSPGMLHIPAGSPGVPSAVVENYVDATWYHLQLVLNDGQGSQSNTSPLDYGYLLGDIYGLFAAEAKVPGIMLQLEYEIKCLQEFTLSGTGPQSQYGFHMIDTSPWWLVEFEHAELWSATSPATEAALIQAYTQAWFNQVSGYTPQQLYQGYWATATENPSTESFGSTFGQQVWYMLPRLRYFGVDPNLTYQISAWAAKIWPLANWTVNNSATCSGGQTASVCTSD